jgi:twitching motility protein PilJ
MKNLKIFNVFGKLKLWQKLMLVAALIGLTLPFVTWQLYTAKTKDINFAQKEIYGTEYLPPLRKLVENVAKHRGLVNLALHGNTAMRDQISASEQGVSAAFQSLNEIDGRAVEGTTYGAMLETTNRIATLKQSWETIKGKSLNAANPEEAFTSHNQLMTDLKDVIVLVGDKSNLILDPDLDTFYLMDSVVVQLPQTIDSTGQIRGLMTGGIASKTLTAAEQNLLSFEAAQAQVSLRNVNNGQRKAFEVNSVAGGDLAGKQQSIEAESFKQGTTFIKKATGFNPATGNAEQIFAEGNQAVDRMFMLYDSSLANLNELLNKRVNNFKNERNSTLGLVAFIIALAAGLAFIVFRNINQQVSSLSHLVKEIELGNTEARAEVISQDELGTLAASFNTTLENTRGLMQSREERDSIQRSIMRLLEEVSTVADGDLTREAAVTEDVTGAIADSFNFMIGELRRIIGQVKNVSLQVTNAATTTQLTTEDLVSKADEQTIQVIKTNEALSEMTTSIEEVSQGAILSASVAQQSLVNARQGARAVQDTIKGMNRIREQVQETSGHIRRLGESSQEIGEIVQLIDEIADQTSILALNASIQAATAGEAGRGFAVVAEEIEQLAERSSQATAKIASLVKSIQMGTNEAITAMDENTKEVVEGSKLALQAGQSLSEIEAVSARLADLIHSISTASKKQTSSSETLSKAMTDISSIITDTTTGIQQSSVTVNSLSVLAEELHSSVASFKLPS